MSKYVVAVVGATGLVGKEMVDTLEKRQFPVSRLIPLASERSLGSTVFFQGQHVPVALLTPSSFEGVDIALFSAGGDISKEYAPFAVSSGAVVVDNTSHFRMHPQVPLVVPEVNGEALKQHQGIIANPNCSTAQMVMALKPLYDAVGIQRLVISTYQSVSGAGKEALEALESQTRAALSGVPHTGKEEPFLFAFNVVPQIDVFLDNGYTKEEMKLIQETQKIFNDASIQVTATAVRVPVFVSHSESVNVQLKSSLSVKKVRSLLSKMPGVQVLDDPEHQHYPMPRLIQSQDDVFVGRIRQDLSHPHGIELWIVADNLRKGAALNAVQIAESLISMSLVAVPQVSVFS